MMDIEQYLRENKPEMPEEGQFLIETNARLRNVEGVKQCVDEDRHRGRTALIIALATGLVLGCLVTLLAVCYPVPSMGAGSAAFDTLIAGLQAWKEVFIALIAACAIALGVVLMTRRQEAL
ncbi:MAG: hypothetical protein J5871_04975 [Bacteroidales bacterium]|nr:hypothetical protein [Bacteroidales bacterium]